MNTLKILCMAGYLLAVNCGIIAQGNKHSIASDDSLKSSKWLTHAELGDTSALDDISLEKLEKLSLEKGAELMQKWYHISQTNYQLTPSYVPSPSNIPVYIIKSHDKKEITNLNNFVKIAKQDPSFGDEEVTIFITGLPSTMETVKEANHKLIHAYIERYNGDERKTGDYKKYHEDASSHGSSEESSSEWSEQKRSSGNLIVIDLGQTIDNLERLAMLNVYETGAMIGKALVQLTNDCNVPEEIIHIVAQGVAAHIAGVAGDEYTYLTGHKLRRITALDPTEILSKNPQVLNGLARGDAEFVDAIHTSVHGMGTSARTGDIDFFPSGLCAGVSGSENVIEASMRATRYFAESVRPGNERNFPAIEANSLKQYKSNDGFGKRAFMGIDTAYDLRGDYMLQVNEKSPFGMRSLFHK